MAIFTKLNIEDLSDVSEKFGEIKQLSPVNGGTDNSVYYLKTKQGDEFIYKLYEGKSDKFFIKLLSIHDIINDILSHQPLLKIIDSTSGKVAILFNYINNNNKYDLVEILLYTKKFHNCINKGKYQKIIDKKTFLEGIKEEMLFFKQNIKNPGYIKKYKEYSFDLLWTIFNNSFSYVLKNKEELLVGYIHNDLNKGNIICSDNGIEFIDFDGVNINLILKDYIIFIIRFNLFNKLDNYFKKVDKNYYIIGEEKVSYKLIKELYKVYSISLIYNMIYYIGYDKKDVKEDMYSGDNQDWKEIYKNLQNNKII